VTLPRAARTATAATTAGKWSASTTPSWPACGGQTLSRGRSSPTPCGRRGEPVGHDRVQPARGPEVARQEPLARRARRSCRVTGAPPSTGTTRPEPGHGDDGSGTAVEPLARGGRTGGPDTDVTAAGAGQAGTRDRGCCQHSTIRRVPSGLMSPLGTSHADPWRERPRMVRGWRQRDNGRTGPGNAKSAWVERRRRRRRPGGLRQGSAMWGRGGLAGQRGAGMPSAAPKSWRE
jgi:hypothetical protein